MPNLRGTDPLVPKTINDAVKLVRWRRQQSKAKAAIEEAKAAKAALAEALKRPPATPFPMPDKPETLPPTPLPMPRKGITWSDDGPIAPKPKRSA